MRPRAQVAALAVAACALASCHDAPHATGHTPRVIVIGVDGMDPKFVREHADVLPTLRGMMDSGGFQELQTTVPPQSPVAWSTVITGLDPGSHGIYDFIHRHPDTLRPYSSMSETTGGDKSIRLGKYRIPLSSGTSRSLRVGSTFWEELTARGIPVTITRMPTNFPPTEDGSRGISGMGTPDMLGTFGTFAYYTDDTRETRSRIRGGRIVRVQADTEQRIRTKLYGPVNSRHVDEPRSEVDLVVDVDPDEPVARIRIGEETRVLEVGDWSDWIPVDFPLIPMLENARGMVRVHLIEVRPVFRLYVSPVNVDPLDPALPIGAPDGHAEALAAAVGRFYTQGMPVDTKAYSAGVLSREDLIEQARIVLGESEALFDYQLSHHEKGLLFFYFSVVDQTSHMLWGRYDDELLGFYREIDRIVGETLASVDGDTQVIVMSDHGFQRFDYKVNLNAWLEREGYLTVGDPSLAQKAGLVSVDWTSTQAYALGFNGLYINREGRESGGIVPSERAGDIKREITEKLLALVDPATGQNVVEAVYDTAELFGGGAEGARGDAPDLIVGYAPPYRQSEATALGRVGRGLIQRNTARWIGDHCMAANRVPGVLFTQPPIDVDEPALADVPTIIMDALGVSETEQGKWPKRSN